MDNQTAKLAIALQLHDLDQLEQSGSLDKAVIDVQRQQLQIDSGFDNVAFESSRRLAVSMAKAIEDDSAVLARTTRAPQLDDATFRRLAALNQLAPPSTDAGSLTRSLSPTNLPSFTNASQTSVPNKGAHHHEGTPCPNGKRPRSPETSDESESHKKLRKHTHNVAEEFETCPVGGATALSNGDLTATEPTASSAANGTLPLKAECASCAGENIDHFIKASCEHHYCRDCFENFIGASLETHDGFPPCCCKIPIAFYIVAANVSPALFSRYRSRQQEVRDATALYCSILGCGVKINAKDIDGTTFRATCATCNRDTCTQCRSEIPLERTDKHVCKRDPTREAVLALAKKEGWQACYQCGTMVSLNFGCHHMTCRCKAEFCYKCGTPWKNCDCGDYDEPRILDRATRAMGIRAARRVARKLPPDPRPREQQLADLQQRLQGNCDHNSFSRREHTKEHPGHCDICEYEGWKFILPCENCQFTSCRECHNYHGWNGGRLWNFEFDFGDLWRQLDNDSEEAEESSEGE